MDRIIIKCLLATKEVELQLDKKAMPGEVGPCFMITEGGYFKGYIAHQRDNLYKHLGLSYYSEDELQKIASQIPNS